MSEGLLTICPRVGNPSEFGFYVRAVALVGDGGLQLLLSFVERVGIRRRRLDDRLTQLIMHSCQMRIDLQRLAIMFDRTLEVSAIDQAFSNHLLHAPRSRRDNRQLV